MRINPTVFIKVRDKRYDANYRIKSFTDYDKAVDYFKKHSNAFNFHSFDTNEWYHSREDFMKAKST